MDLVLTRGFSVHICEIFDAGISDHYPCGVLTCQFHMISPSFLGLYITLVLFMQILALELCESYSKFLSNSNVPPSSCMDTEQLVEIFNSACCTALNTVAPLKRKKCKISSSPQPCLMHPLALSDKSAGGLSAGGKKDGLPGILSNLKKLLNCLSKFR